MSLEQVYYVVGIVSFVLSGIATITRFFIKYRIVIVPRKKGNR
jgi:hypothetical protein